MALVAVIFLGVRKGRYFEGKLIAFPPSNIPFLALGAWILSIGALVVGSVAGALFVYVFTLLQNRWKIDNVLGVWPLHGICGAWGGIAAGIFGASALGGMGGVSFMSQLAGTLMGISIAIISAVIIYAPIKHFMGIRLTEEEEFKGADISIHKIETTSDD